MLLHLKPLTDKQISRTFKQGSTILYQGEVPRSACILTKGVVRVYSISSQGEDQIVSIHRRGEFFPTSWIFQKSTGAMFFYEALTDCEVSFAPRDELIEFMSATPERSKALLDYFATNYAASLIRINALEQPKARDKLVYTLYYLCQRFGKSLTTGKIEIPIALTHQNFANLVGITRETTAMEMSRLKKQGILTYRKQKYTVNIDKLVEQVGEESFKSVSIAD